MEQEQARLSYQVNHPQVMEDISDGEEGNDGAVFGGGDEDAIDDHPYGDDDNRTQYGVL